MSCKHSFLLPPDECSRRRSVTNELFLHERRDKYSCILWTSSNLKGELWTQRRDFMGGIHIDSLFQDIPVICKLQSQPLIQEITSNLQS
jgi:hypothetical protein